MRRGNQHSTTSAAGYGLCCLDGAARASKTVFTATYNVSTDGKTMTVNGKNAKGETIKQIWQKQGS